MKDEFKMEADPWKECERLKAALAVAEQERDEAVTNHALLANDYKELQRDVVSWKAMHDTKHKQGCDLIGRVLQLEAALAAEKEKYALCPKCGHKMLFKYPSPPDPKFVEHLEAAWNYYDEYGSLENKDSVGLMLDKIRGKK